MVLNTQQMKVAGINTKVRSWNELGLMQWTMHVNVLYNNVRQEIYRMCLELTQCNQHRCWRCHYTHRLTSQSFYNFFIASSLSSQLVHYWDNMFCIYTFKSTHLKMLWYLFNFVVFVCVLPILRMFLSCVW